MSKERNTKLFDTTLKLLCKILFQMPARMKDTGFMLCAFEMECNNLSGNTRNKHTKKKRYYGTSDIDIILLLLSSFFLSLLYFTNLGHTTHCNARLRQCRKNNSFIQVITQFLSYMYVSEK